jgi:hypothetical protein
MRPNFFLIGAPKTGTTSLAGFLAAHPHAFVPEAKEPSFFADDLPAYQHVDNTADYLALFAPASERVVAVGEASVFYLFSETAIDNILAFAPDARFVVVCRDPVELVHSLHTHFLQNFNETESDFERAWALQGARANGEHIPPEALEPATLQYLKVCSLGAQVQRLYGLVPKERVLLLRFDVLVSEPAAVLERLQDFLGLPRVAEPALPHANAAKTNRSSTIAKLLYRPPAPIRAIRDGLKRALGGRGTGLGMFVHRFNRKPVKRAFEEGAFKDEVREAFAEDTRLLASLANWDLGAWLPVAK